MTFMSHIRYKRHGKSDENKSNTNDSNRRMVKSMSKEEWGGGRELEEMTDDMRTKSRLLLSR